MSDIAAIRRQLKIKSGVAKRYVYGGDTPSPFISSLFIIRSFYSDGRLQKDHTLYQKEAEDQKLKLDKFVADGAEEWDIKNAVCPSKLN